MTSVNDHLRQESGSKGLDFSAVLRAVWPPFLIWGTVVLLLTFAARQPGVVCITPVAWLLACWVGVTCVARSRSEKKSTLLTESALAGGVLGLLQGLLFAVVAPFMGVRPEEQQKSFMMSLGIIVVGMIVSAVLSMVVGAGQANRRVAK